MSKTVNDMYTYAKDNNVKLLSTYSATFWNEYTTNSTKYDKLFNRMYKSFRYFNQEEDDTIATITTDFVDEVYNHLLVNNKKYEELYRIHVLTDSNYDLLNNYKMTEVMDGEKVTDGQYVLGTRSDSGSETLGARVDTVENQVSAYNSSSYSNNTKSTDNLGAQSNSTSSTKGQQTNTDDTTVTDDYTLTKTGKTDGRSNAEILQTNIDLWTNYQFYTMIFKEICGELLLV